MHGNKVRIACELGNILSMFKNSATLQFQYFKDNNELNTKLSHLLITLPELEKYYFTVYCFTVYFTEVTSLIGYIVKIDMENRQE